MVEKLYGHEMEGHNKALWAIRSLYPGNADLAKENLHKTAQVFRGICNEKSIKVKQLLDLDKLDMNKFHKDTTSKYFILQCKLQVCKNASNLFLKMINF